jgi:hypothetical protein
VYQKDGWLVSIRDVDVVTKDSNFFPFGHSFLRPGEMRRHAHLVADHLHSSLQGAVI